MVGRTIRIMAVGIPNVGKSAFINAMCRGGNAGKADVHFFGRTGGVVPTPDEIVDALKKMKEGK